MCQPIDTRAELGFVEYPTKELPVLENHILFRVPEREATFMVLDLKLRWVFLY